MAGGGDARMVARSTFDRHDSPPLVVALTLVLDIIAMVAGPAGAEHRHPTSAIRSRLIRRLVAASLTAAIALAGFGAGSALAAGVANDDAYGITVPFVLEDGAFTVPAPGVLGNDAAGAGESLCIVSPPTTSAQGGTVALGVDGSLTYTSPANFAGADSFTYGVAGVAGGGTCPGVPDDTALVSLTVTQVNDAPSIFVVGGCASGITVDEDSGTFLGEDGCLAMNPGPANESSQEAAEWPIEVSGDVAFSAGPTITADGFLQFRPAPNDHGTATVTVRGRDNGGTANGGSDTSVPRTFTITVRSVGDAPTAAPDSFVALKDRTLSIASPGVLGNDTDADGDSITALLVSSPVHGALTLASNGSFTYTPTAGYVGPDAFAYRATDGGLSSATRIVSLTVSAVPLPTPSPVITLPPASEAPTVEPTFDVTPEPTLEPTISPGPGQTVEVSASPTATPAATAAPKPTAGAGGPSLPLLLVGVLFAVLLVFAGVYYASRWRSGQRDEPVDPPG